MGAHCVYPVRGQSLGLSGDSEVIQEVRVMRWALDWKRQPREKRDQK